MGGSERTVDLDVDLSKQHGHTVHPGCFSCAAPMSRGGSDVGRILRCAFSPGAAYEALMARKGIVAIILAITSVLFFPEGERTEAGGIITGDLTAS